MSRVLHMSPLLLGGGDAGTDLYRHSMWYRSSFANIAIPLQSHWNGIFVGER